MTQKQSNLKRAIEAALMKYWQSKPNVIAVEDVDIIFSDLVDNEGKRIEYDDLESCCHGDYEGTIRITTLDSDLKIPISDKIRKSGSFAVTVDKSETEPINISILSCV